MHLHTDRASPHDPWRSAEHTADSACVVATLRTYSQLHGECKGAYAAAAAPPLQVCEATPDKTPRCPFCRRVVDAVVPAAVKPPLLVGGGAVAPVPNRAPLLSGLDDICNAAIAAQS
jgi:hypothetical protein